jgi:hypothetical protein
VFVERLLQINVATFTVLGAMLLGMGQRNTGMPLSVLIAAVASLALTDFSRLFRLNRVVTNLLALGALVLAVWELLHWDSPYRTLAVANLLAYLQIILLFQEKEFRTYCQLVMLSLLQVIVVSSVFNGGYGFGIGLVVYFFTGLSVSTLLLLYREHSLCHPPEAGLAGTSGWPPHGRATRFGTASGGSDRHGPVVPELWSRIARIGAGILVLTLLLFPITPRFGRSGWERAVEPRYAVGFSDQVVLGELGRVIEDSSEIMRVRLSDPATGEPYPTLDAFYLRGTVLTHYQNGQWHYRADWPTRRYRRLKPPPTGLPDGWALQEIAIEPMDRQELFSAWPFAARQPDRRILFDLYLQRLMRREAWRMRRFRYALATTAFVGGRQAAIVPCDEPVGLDYLLSLPSAEDGDAVPRLIQTAAEWVEDSQVPVGDPSTVARMLERQLRDSGRFQYSLQPQSRNPRIDPIEDFIATSRRGHCEYFATALTLMLRSQGIPARLVVGYKCDEWNDPGDFYLVRQLHAHAWVEAYLAPNQIPATRRGGEDDTKWSQGAWLRLDPSPAASAPDAGTMGSLVERTSAYLTWLDYLWDDYVMRMDAPRQRQAIYKPVAETVGAMLKRARDPDWWRAAWSNCCRAVRQGLQAMKDGRWFSWRGGFVAVAAMLLAAVLYRTGRFLWRRWKLWASGRVRTGRRARPARVEFYCRLEALLARCGLVRSDCQTHREFAMEAGQRLALTSGEPQVAELPGRVVDAFYLVRFGGAALDRDVQERVEQALQRLERAVGPWMPAP